MSALTAVAGGRNWTSVALEGVSLRKIVYALCVILITSSCVSAQLSTISPWRNIQEDGALCDGITDDTSAVRAAITHSAALQFPQGTCVLDTVSLADKQTLVIRGAGVGLTILQHKAGAANGILEGPAVGFAASIDLRDMTIDGNHTQQADWELDSIGILRVNRFYMDNVEMHSCKRSCVRLAQVNTSATIQHSYFHDMALHGGASGQDTAALLFTKEAHADSVITVTQNRFEQTAAPVGAGNSVGGIVLFPTNTKYQKAIITYNTLINMGQEIAGNIQSPILCYRDCVDSLIHGNILLNSYTSPITWQRSSNTLISHNLMSGSANIVGNRPSIQVTGRVPLTPQDRLQVSNNIIRDVTDAGACIYVVYDPLPHNIYDISILNNYCKNSGGGIYLKEVSGAVIIHGNTLSNITNASASTMSGIALINVYGPLVNISYNSMRNIQQRGIFYSEAAMRTAAVVIADNYFEDTGLDAAALHSIQLKNVASARIQGNTWADITGASTTPRLRTEQVPVLFVHDNIAPTSAVITHAPGSGGTQFKSHNNTWVN